MKNIAVFGVGHLGYIHCQCILSMKDANLIGIYDIDTERCNQVAKELDLTAFSTPEALLQVCDVADIVTTTSEHYDMAKMAIMAGKHTFIEKPVVVGFAHAEELITLSKEMGVKVQVGHVERFNPAFVAARPLIHNPMFIEAHRLANFNPRGNDVSVVMDLMIHDIDLILNVVNSTIVDIQASGVAVVTDSFDIANVRLRFENGCVANLTASRISLKNMRKIRFFQPNAYIMLTC
jgi:predicted dehydrogenase